MVKTGSGYSERAAVALLTVLAFGPATGAPDEGVATSVNETRVEIGPYDPLERASATIGRTKNLEAGVPPQCYTATSGISNPCWTCHTRSVDPNFRTDWDLQEEYSFSDVALTNHWTNLFRDRTAEIAAISDDEALRYVRSDNYAALAGALGARPDYHGFVPDLDFEQGFDEEGFARDDSGWRAIRFKPFPGTFWPTNGSTDDVMIRLPERFRRGADGALSRAVYRSNLSILEAAIGATPGVEVAKLCREVEPLDESAAAMDLDGDGRIGGIAQRIRGLPATYAGGASDIKVKRYLHPPGTEYLHTVRYIDPESPTLLSRRMKEVRYSRKVEDLDNWARVNAYEKEIDEKDEGLVPVYRGSPFVGLRNAFGWQIQGFIEDARGRLRLQTDEEHRFCMGCHGSIGVTVDHTFTLPRKVPGAAGWRHQDLRGIPDVPQAGHDEPEILTYFERVRGGDEFRANTEVLERFFDGGSVRESLVRRAAPGGDKDITFLITPSRERALLLDKAYMVLVREQSFDRGRDAVIQPVANVHRSIRNGSTELRSARKVVRDGKLWLDWGKSGCE